MSHRPDSLRELRPAPAPARPSRGAYDMAADMIRGCGDAAEDRAVGQIDRLLTTNDREGLRLWVEILSAMSELRRTERLAEALH